MSIKTIRKHLKSPNITDVKLGAFGKCRCGDFYINILFGVEAIYNTELYAVPLILCCFYFT